MAQHRHPDDIQKEIVAARQALANDVSRTHARARQLVDWRHQFRVHPAALCGAAAVLGYYIVPKRKKPDVVAPLVEDEQLASKFDGEVSHAAAAPSIASQLARMIALAVAKHAIKTVSEQGLSMFHRVRAAQQPNGEQPAERDGDQAAERVDETRPSGDDGHE